MQILGLFDTVVVEVKTFLLKKLKSDWLWPYCGGPRIEKKFQRGDLRENFEKHNQRFSPFVTT